MGGECPVDGLHIGEVFCLGKSPKLDLFSLLFLFCLWEGRRGSCDGLSFGVTGMGKCDPDCRSMLVRNIGFAPNNICSWRDCEAQSRPMSAGVMAYFAVKAAKGLEETREAYQTNRNGNRHLII